jgi:heptosyltransferase-1
VVPVGRHAVERVRELFAKSLGYAVPDGPGDYGLDRGTLVPADPDARPYLVFLHGTTWATKHWPETYWRQLAERACADGWEIRLPWGNAVELARAERLAAGLPSATVLPQLKLAGIAREIAGARACEGGHFYWFLIFFVQLRDNYPKYLTVVLKIRDFIILFRSFFHIF